MADIQRTNPAMERRPLREEVKSTSIQGSRRVRVLSHFEIFCNGQPASVPEAMLTQQQFAGMDVVGIIASMDEPQGLHAQCGWFGMDKIDWFWARIESIQELRVCNDERFHGGAPCVVLRSDMADYFLLNPHPDYTNLWQPTLVALNAPVYEAWQEEVRPSWWPNQWASWWPFSQPVTVLKPRASSDATEEQALVQDSSVGPARSENNQGDQQDNEVTLTRLSHRHPWVLEPNSGFQPALGAGERESAQTAQRNPSERTGPPAAKRARR